MMKRDSAPRRPSNDSGAATAMAPSVGGDVLEPGTLVGSFVVEAVCDKGGFGTVYRARAPEGRPAAVKVLHAELSRSPTMLRRFLYEAEVARHVRHPAIARIREVGDLTDGRPYIAMDWVDGETLEAVLSRGPLPHEAAIAVFEELAGAIAATHAAGIVHRDIKSSNVMVVEGSAARPRIVLLDFGIAKRLDEEHDLTATGIRVGTPSYMAPEQILGQPVGPSTDVYSLGVLLFHMITGELPFVADSTIEVQEMHLGSPVPRASDWPDVTHALADVVARCMAKTPSDRYACVDELLTDLRAAASRGDVPDSAVRVTSARALGIRVAVPTPVDSEVAADVLQAATARIEREDGFRIALTTGRSVVAVAPLAGPKRAGASIRERALALARALSESLDPHAGIAVHAGTVLQLHVGGAAQLVGGELLEEPWGRDSPGLHVTSAVEGPTPST